MFSGCKSFEGKGLENWQVNNNTFKKYMFDHCESLKTLPSWFKEY